MRACVRACVRNSTRGRRPRSAAARKKKIKVSLLLIKLIFPDSKRRSYLGWQCFAQAQDAGWPPASGRVMGSLVWAVSVEILALPVMGSASLSSQAGDGQASLEKLGRVKLIFPDYERKIIPRLTVEWFYGTFFLAGRAL